MVSQDQTVPLIFGITGASGAPYAVRLLEALNQSGTPVRLIVSTYGMRLLAEECGIGSMEELRSSTGDWSRVELYDSLDRGATPASGSARSRGMVICPCSMGTLASIAAGTSRNLVERAADVVLKERRPLILVPRETPLSLIHLENMRRLTIAGATILPASPGFYHRPQKVQELVDFVVARILDQLGVENTIGQRWRSGEAAAVDEAQEYEQERER
ncbi:flavin prenyltransferase UbiX [soil metagenome]